MFTGIITDVGQIRSLDHTGDDSRDRLFTIRASYETEKINVGASIACSGVCLTVIETGADWFAVQVSNETLGCTTLADWVPGTPVNLECALKFSDELSGHIVSGHVDGVGRVAGIDPDGESHRLRVWTPVGLARMVATKGSVTVEGVSLTVNNTESASGRDYFTVNIIPHTMTSTTLGRLSTGDPVNLEVDLLARYVARLLSRE